MFRYIKCVDWDFVKLEFNIVKIVLVSVLSFIKYFCIKIFVVDKMMIYKIKKMIKFLWYKNLFVFNFIIMFDLCIKLWK